MRVFDDLSTGRRENLVEVEAEGRATPVSVQGYLTAIPRGLEAAADIIFFIFVIGGVFGIAFGKIIFGGLGQNVFNPALLGRAFLQAAFPIAITTWPVQPGNWWSLRGDNFALPLMSPSAPDVATGATPLGLMKFEGLPTNTWDLMIGSTAGSIGETAGLLILLCGGYLALRKYLDWRIPLSIFLTVFVFSGGLYLIGPDRFPNPVFMLFSGGLMLGAMYMATDMVTSPVTPTGSWIFGIGIGLLVVLIRVWGGLPEGVMYAILLGNALTPHLDRWTRPTVFGTKRKEAAS